MFMLIIFPILYGVVNADALNKFNEEMEAGAKWHYVGEQEPDPKAKSIKLNGKIYHKLKWKDKK